MIVSFRDNLLRYIGATIEPIYTSATLYEAVLYSILAQAPVTDPILGAPITVFISALVPTYTSANLKVSSKWYLCAREGPYCAPLHLSGVSQMLPLKQFQCWSD